VPPGGSGTGGDGGRLPTTGSDQTAPLAVAALLLVVGVGTLAVRRRGAAGR
jgi:LPXTG-motif cell wall-anchored protein